MLRQSRLLAPLFLLLLTAAAWACNVPVFRYALERWNPDAYEVWIFRDAPLTAEQRAMVGVIENQVAGRAQQLDSFYLSEVDTTRPMDDRARAVHEAIKPATYPQLVVQFPRSQPADPAVYSGPLTAEAAATLADSPMRRAVAKKILEGESVVWLLVESGNKEKDDAAATLLAKELARLSGQLLLPELDATDKQFHDPDAGPKLRISFALLRMSRSDAKEAMFLRLLENWSASEPDRSEPQAYAIFGRGRALPPLSGKYLSARFLEEANTFLVGRCSCQVKEENPGWDLLMPVDWDAVMRGRIALSEALPPLTSATTVVQQNEAIEKAVGQKLFAIESLALSEPAEAPGRATESTLLRTVFTLVGYALFFIVAVTIWLRSRGNA